MPVEVNFMDRNGPKPKLLTVESATTWLGQEGRAKLANPLLAGILPMFLHHWDKRYETNEQQMFLLHLTEYFMPQVELLRGIRDLGARIVHDYSPQAYLYVGIGRSPAPIMAYLQNEHYRTVTIPLSDFRPRNSVWSITDQALGARPRISDAQKQELFTHFGRYFPGQPARRQLLVIDYTQSATSLIAAQEQLQQFFASQNMADVQVHALAICRDSDAAMARGVGQSVGAQRGLMNPVDWLYYSTERQQFAQRWHVMPVVEFGVPQTKRQELVMRALSGQGFDDLAEFGSYKILSNPVGTLPTQYTNNPAAPAAYDILRQEIAKV